MNNKIEYNGYWWLPGQKDNRICGSLIISPFKELELNLMGTFKKFQSGTRLVSSDNSFFKDEEIILGQTVEGNRITLHKCHNTARFLDITVDMSKSSYKIEFTFIGHHFEKNEDIQFNSVSINYSNLEYWLERPEIVLSKNKEKNETNIMWKSSPTISYNLEDFQLIFRWEMSSTMPRLTSLEIQERAFVQIEANSSMNLQFYRDKFYLFQNLLSLGIGKPVHPLKIVGKNDKAKIISDFTSKPHYIDIEIYYNYASNWKENNELVHPREMLFSYTDISSIFETCIRNWYSKYQNLEPVYDLYFGVVYNQNMYLQNMFLNLAQALESYHRRTLGGKYLSDAEYDSIKESLTKSIPSGIDLSFRDSLINRIKYGNDFSLRKRLKEIFSKLEVNEKLNLNIPGDKNNLIKDLVNMRDQLTHYEKEAGEEYKELPKMVIYCDIMKYLLEVCFLLELGLTGELLENIIRKIKLITPTIVS